MLDRRKLAILLVILLFAASVTVFLNYLRHWPSPLGTIVVPTDYPTIQAAINNSWPGDTIYVRNGNYTEEIVIDKPLTLIGQNPEKTVIHGHYEKYMSFVNVIVNASDVSISNFTITGCTYGVTLGSKCSNCQLTNNIINGFGEGVSIAGANIAITNNSISANCGNAITCVGNNTLISQNDIGNCERGIVIKGNASDVIVEKNTVSNGVTHDGVYSGLYDYLYGGIVLGPGKNCEVFENNVNGFKNGIQYQGANNSLVYTNSLTNCSVGVSVQNYYFYSVETPSIGSGNLFFSNNLLDNQRQAVVETTATHQVPNELNGTDLVSWDNGTVGNYWGDYQTRYPDATQNSATGTYNTPYIIDANNKDNYPLIQAAKTQSRQ